MRVPLLLITALFLASCSPRTVEITGEVYITTKGRSTVKMSGTAIHVLDYQAVKDVMERSYTSDLYEYLKQMPPPIAGTNTDADGKFAIKLKPGRYVLTSLDQRDVGGQTEFYQWLVLVDAPADTKITLNNSNLAGGPGSLIPPTVKSPY